MHSTADHPVAYRSDRLRARTGTCRAIRAGSLRAGIVAALAAALFVAGCGGGGSSGGSGGNDLLSVKSSQGFPNGRFFPVAPSPSTQNQCIWIELTAEVDPKTVFDGTTDNGLSSAVRMLMYYYGINETQINPATPVIRQRLPGVAVLNGMTNFNPSTGNYAASAIYPVTHQDLNIPTNVPISGNGNYLVFVADDDGNLQTADSFMPRAVSTNASLRQNAQLSVALTDGVKSVAGRTLSPEFTTSFIVGSQDQIAPVVETTVPAKDSTNIPVGDPIRIRFSEPIEASSISLAPLGLTSPPPATAGINLQVMAQVISPSSPTPTLQTMDGVLTPASGQTTEIVFTPRGDFPGNTLMIVNLFSAANTLSGPAPPYYPALSDASANLLAPNSFTDQQFRFTTGNGPQRANNPVDPECIHFITASSELGTVLTNWTDRAATGFEDRVVEVDANGKLAQFFTGGVQDGVVGPMLTSTLTQLSAFPGNQQFNTISNPPRQCSYWLAGFPNRGNPPTQQLVNPGTFSPGALADIMACVGTTLQPNPLPNPIPPPPLNWCPELLPQRPNIKPGLPIGSYLFVTNDANNVVHCINGNTFQILKDIPTPDPRGVGITPDLRTLFVSNFGANSVSVLDITGGPDGLPRGDLIRLIPVGQGPVGVAVSPTQEDVFVCNRLGGSVSVIKVGSIGSPGDPVRLTLQVGDPYEANCGARLGSFPYWAYVTSPGTGEVAIFESGPLQTNGFGRDAVINVIGQLARPTGICGDQWFNTTSGLNPVPRNDSITGAYVAMNGDGTVQHLKLTRIVTTPLPNPPPSLIEARFEVTQTIPLASPGPKDVTVNNNMILCTTPDGKQWPYVATPTPVTTSPDRLYIANGDGSISVHRVSTGLQVSVLPASGASRIFGYFKQ